MLIFSVRTFDFLWSHRSSLSKLVAPVTPKKQGLLTKHPVGQTKGTLINDVGVCGLSVGLRALQDASRGPNEFHRRRSLAPKRLLLRTRGGEQQLGHLAVEVEAL